MGGNVNVSIRKPDGTWEKMVRWTNTLPRINDRSFLEAGESFAEYMNSWTEFCDDFDSGAFQLPMSRVYAGDEMRGKMAPVEYGIVIVDFVDKRIISSQGYTALGRTYHRNFTRNAMWMEEDEAKEYFENFDGRFKNAVFTFEDANRPNETHDLRGMTTQEVVDFCEKHKPFFDDLYVDMLGFDLIDTGDDIKKCREEIEKYYELSDVETAAWDEFIKDREY